ncbi:MAG: hypothetical protein PW792_04355 [Acidobacteriaceae bacterium]|nr:hypothetical protein [Acidobacteriaceae bacterium]
MPLIEDEQIAERAEQRSGFRVITAGTKLNRVEFDALEQHCRTRGTNQGELIRSLILRELERPSSTPAASPELVEIIGLRLMLTNLLRPLSQAQSITQERFDAIMMEVRRSKSDIAMELVKKSEGGR